MKTRATAAAVQTPPIAQALVPAEIQLLLLATGGRENDAAIRALLERDLDWPVLLAMVDGENIAPTLWRRLAALSSDRVPAEAATQLQRLAMVAQFRMAHLEQRLEEAVGVLADAGIRPTLLKGAALVHTVYGSATERPMRDIDLLVDADRVAEAWSLLREAGWTWSQEEMPDARYQEHHHLPPLVDARGTAIGLEVHRELFFKGHPFHLSAAEVIRNTRPVRVGRYVAYAPDATYLLLHAAMHFAWSHSLGWGALRAFQDVHALAGAGVPWDRFVELARRSRAATCCYWTLRLARRLGGAPVPEGVLAMLRPPLPEGVLRRLERHFTLAALSSTLPCPSARLERALWSLAILPRYSGHGSARPWDRDDEFTPAADGRSEASPGAERPSTVANQLRVIRRSTHYLRAILQVNAIAH